jgi:hypothetical protein
MGMVVGFENCQSADFYSATDNDAASFDISFDFHLSFLLSESFTAIAL